MSSTDSRFVSAPILIGIFSVVYMGCFMVWLVADKFFGGNWSGVGLPAIATMLAAGVAARYWLWCEKSLPGGLRAWAYGLFCGIAAVIMRLALSWLMNDGYLRLSLTMWREYGWKAIAPLIGAIALTVCADALIVRLGFWITFRWLAKRYDGRNDGEKIEEVFR